jgi:hypothetical protein
MFGRCTFYNMAFDLFDELAASEDAVLAGGGQMLVAEKLYPMGRKLLSPTLGFKATTTQRSLSVSGCHS